VIVQGPTRTGPTSSSARPNGCSVATTSTTAPSGGSQSGGGSFLDQIRGLFGVENAEAPEQAGELDGIQARPEPAIIADDPDDLNEYQVEKLLYMLKRDFIGYAKIDPVKHDINVEDISCDGYDSRVFVYHTDYEQIISNVEHGRESLDDFVVELAQRSGKVSPSANRRSTRRYRTARVPS